MAGPNLVCVRKPACRFHHHLDKSAPSYSEAKLSLVGTRCSLPMLPFNLTQSRHNRVLPMFVPAVGTAGRDMAAAGQHQLNMPGWHVEWKRWHPPTFPSSCMCGFRTFAFPGLARIMIVPQALTIAPYLPPESPSSRCLRSPQRPLT